MKKNLFTTEYEEKLLSALEIEAEERDLDPEKRRQRTAYYLLNGAPTLAVAYDGENYSLLSPALDFFAAKDGGMTEFNARVYRISEKEKQAFRLLYFLREGGKAMDEAYAMKELLSLGFTQDKIARFTGKSRPAVANTLRLLTLEAEVIGLIESGKLSAGHARALVRVPKDKQYPFAMETVEKGCSVRETERAVKAYLTPPQILGEELAAREAAKNAELKALAVRARNTLKMGVSLIGNEKKGRLYIDYRSTEELYRFEEYLEIIEKFNGK